MAGRVSGKIDMDGGQGLVLVLWRIISLLCLPQLAHDALLHSIAAQLDGTSRAAVADYDDRSLAWIHSIRRSSTIFSLFFSSFVFSLLFGRFIENGPRVFFPPPPPDSNTDKYKS